MSDYPVVLRPEGRLCVVVGAGAVGLRKAKGLARAGALVRLIDPEPLTCAEEAEGIEVLRRPYREGDLEGAFLAFAATGCRDTNAAIAHEARRRGVLLNSADDPEGGDFSLPALLRRDALTLAVCTGGRSPAFAAAFRNRLGTLVGPEWGAPLEIAAALRQKRLTPGSKPEYNQAVLNQLINSDLPALIAGGETAAVDRCLTTLFGNGFSLAELGVRLEKG